MKFRLTIPIRARILLLAAITLISVSSALYLQFREINGEVSAIEKRVTTFDLVRTTSALVHSLQKERGLSGLYLADVSKQEVGLLLQDKQNRTDAILSSIVLQETNSLLSADWLSNLTNQLAVIRDRVSTRSIPWSDVRDFYTDAINFALDGISIDIEEGSQDTKSRLFSALTSLSYARENLGLVRAGVARVYDYKRLDAEDRRDIIKYFGAFHAYHRAFVRDLMIQDRASMLSRVFSPEFTAVLSQINALIVSNDNEIQGYSVQKWWDDTTNVIDSMKLLEDRLYLEISEALVQKQ
ncbi:MAG: nitrate- and nitrite sensing domain-containing protein, partial [Alphaproteobacteria bacterium]|nr:nitrate- and nitrite sensing domain-containing protein [Alphaproteobacteria bacterium]